MMRLIARGALLTTLLAAACSDPAPEPTPEPDTSADLAADAADAAPDTPDLNIPLGPYPAPGAWEPNHGPGIPAMSFAPEALYQNCAFLSGGPNDVQHHNLLVMYDGYLLMPWAPEWSRGGITLFDISDPCAPTVAGHGEDRLMRESHSIGFSSQGGRWAVVNALQRLPQRGGVQFWDLADITQPKKVSDLELPGFFYPDAYKKIVLSVFWQAPYVYAAGSQNGVYIIDASDPLAPALVNTYQFDPVMQAGQIHAIGNLLIVTSSEQSRTVLLDISDPANPQPIPGGDFTSIGRDGERVNAYFTNTANGYIYYAVKSNGGGILIYDIHDPTRPTLAGEHRSDGNGGYVFVKDHLAFVGESNFAAIYDLSDLDNITEVTRMHLEGDLDTITPIGHLAVLSVDDKANPDQGSAIAPYASEPDTTPPRVTWSWPDDGATLLPVTSRVGVTFNEMIDVKSAWAGSVRLYRQDLPPDEGRVDAIISAQESIVNLWPVAPLEPDTTYVFEIPAGGIHDFSGNALVEPFSLTFTTEP